MAHRCEAGVVYNNNPFAENKIANVYCIPCRIPSKTISAKGSTSREADHNLRLAISDYVNKNCPRLKPQQDL